MWVFAHGMINLVAMQVVGMARAVEAQAPYTHGHAERFTHYALQLSGRTMAPNLRGHLCSPLPPGCRLAGIRAM